jgi:hypothetical protein
MEGSSRSEGDKDVGVREGSGLSAIDKTLKIEVKAKYLG